MHCNWLSVLTGILLVATAAAEPPRAPAPRAPTDPADALQVAALLGEAEQKQAAGQWVEAATLYERIVHLNPTNPLYWNALGNAHYYAKSYKAAIPAYERAAELGAPTMGAYYSIYNLACCQALAGEKESAMQSLLRAFELGFPDFHHPSRDEDLVSLRDDPRFIELLGLKDVSKMSRDEGWRYDLEILAREVHRKGFNRHLYVNRPVTTQQFDERVRRLHDAIPSLSDGQVILEMTKLMAFLQDGHTAVWPTGEHPLFRAALPLRLYWFEEGLFVTAADPRYEQLLGAQVLAMDGRPIEQVLEHLEQYENRDRGNPMKDKVSAPYVIRVLSLLHAAGQINSPDRVTLSVRDFSGSPREVVVEADSKEPNIWNKLPAPESWVTFASKLENPPLYLRNMHQKQWFEYLPEEKTVYFAFNGVQNGRDETLAQFTQRLFKFIDENDVEKLVIDLRWNNGGNTFLGHPLLLELISNQKLNQPGRLFVIIGRRTYSAAQNMSTYIERYTSAIFVGEPTGSSPNFVGEEVPITLPYSKVMANVSHLFWQSTWPQDQRIWLAPQIYIPPRFEDYRAGRDPVLQAVLAYPQP